MRAPFALRRGCALAALGMTLTGCGHLSALGGGAREVPVLTGPPVRDNRTPMDEALRCFGARLAAARGARPVIAVGEVRDYTGKYSINEGSAITQGGALMVVSALGKLGGSVAIAERFDPGVGERELAYTDRRQLGDGKLHAVGEATGQRVAWLPYYGGSIAASDFFIVGGVTELNHNIRSGGGELRIGQTGPKARTYTQSVAVDLRIVDTRSLLVVHALSLTKQFSGYEVGFNVFRFFGSELFDINLGAKAQEPLQLGIRTALEEATLRLVAAATGQGDGPCLLRETARPSDATAVGPPIIARAVGSPGTPPRVPAATDGLSQQ